MSVRCLYLIFIFSTTGVVCVVSTIGDGSNSLYVVCYLFIENNLQKTKGSKANCFQTFWTNSTFAVLEILNFNLIRMNPHGITFKTLIYYTTNTAFCQVVYQHLYYMQNNYFNAYFKSPSIYNSMYPSVDIFIAIP